MACKLHHHAPLAQLAREIGAQLGCQSPREDCVLAKDREPGMLGMPGAVFGTCQAVLPFTGDPLTHTEKVARVLEEAGMPFSGSHELFSGYLERWEAGIPEALNRASRPLGADGRVPIVITGWDPGESSGRERIRALTSATPARMAPNGTVLCRVLLNNGASVDQAVALSQEWLRLARTRRALPPWWLVIQPGAGLPAGELARYRALMGDDWRFVTAAANPFTSPEAIEELWGQIAVIQLPIGPAGGISQDGTVRLGPVKVAGSGDSGQCNVLEFTDRFRDHPSVPVMIALGPSPSWEEQEDRNRLSAFAPLARKACEALWGTRLPKERIDYVLTLSA